MPPLSHIPTTTNNQQPTTNNQQPTANDKQKKANGRDKREEGRVKRCWSVEYNIYIYGRLPKPMFANGPPPKEL